MDSIEQNTEDVIDVPGARTRRRRRLLWSFGVVVLLLLLALTPPLVNVSRLRLRIAASMSAALGRPVHLDRVSMHLLPVPGFTLVNLVVSEDPAFGYEPVIRAMKVELTPRLSSLWRRQVEIATIRFETDDNGSAPSLNLVRNAQGQWNVQSLLMHAAQVNAEPTAQATAGPTPRFPYIEATGGRVNLKLGEEKQPFSLLDADFALWLPTPESWHVRLEGKPTRTDTNASDTGTVTLEGQLRRAAKMGDVPVDLRAAWRNAPLGEASKLITGQDAGWRGTLLVNATLTGPLSSAKLNTQAHLNDLRRADFVPAKLLNVSVECKSDMDVTNAVAINPSCAVGTPVPEGRKDVGEVVAIAEKVDLQAVQTPGFGATGLRVAMTNVANTWLLDWARLFSLRIPVKESLPGTVAGSMVLASAVAGAAPTWQGEFHADGMTSKAAKSASDTAADAGGLTLIVHPESAPDGGTEFVLAPVNLGSVSGMPTLTLSGQATQHSYSLHLAGAATAQELDSLRSLLPVLGDGMEVAVPELNEISSVQPVTGAKPEPTKTLKLNITCTRVWPAAQSCVNAMPESPKPVYRKH